MNREELLKMLDLAGKEAPPAEGEPLTVTPAEREGKPLASPTALKVDGWGLRKGEELLESSPRLSGTKLTKEAVADFHTAAFEPSPELLAACTDERRREFLKQMFETPEYKALHATTMLREEAAEVAALSFADAYEKLLDEDADAAEEKEREERRKATGRPGDRGKGLIVAAPPMKDDALEKEIRAVRAAGAALAEASKEVEEMDEAVRALGAGPGGEGGSNDPKRIAELYLKIRSNRTLRRICELAGRYRRHAASKQRMKTVHGYDDMVGVTLDGDPARLVSGELAKLGVEELELDVMRRLVERQAVCRLHQAVEPVAKGPIVVVVDESGSMSGEPVHTAKAIALALAWVARQQRRWCALVAFSGGTEGRTLALPPGRWDEAALMVWLEEFLDGGTSLDVPLHELPFCYWPRFTAQGLQRGKTDVVILTDAIVHAPTDTVTAFNAWRAKEKVRVTSLIIGARPGDLEKVSDECHIVTANLGTDEEGVDRALSI